MKREHARVAYGGRGPPPASAPSCPVIRGGREAAGPGPAGKGGSLGFCDPYRDPGRPFQAWENERSAYFTRFFAIVAAFAHVFARHVETLARRPTSLAIGTLAYEHSTEKRRLCVK